MPKIHILSQNWIFRQNMDFCNSVIQDHSLFFRWQSTTSAAAAAAQYSNFSRAAAASGTALPPSRPYLNPATTSLEAAYSPYHLGSTTMPQSFTSSVSEKESKMISSDNGSTYQSSSMHASSATSTNFTPYHNLGKLNKKCSNKFWIVWKITNDKKFVKVCLHFLQFDEYFVINFKVLISRIWGVLYPRLVGTSRTSIIQFCNFLQVPRWVIITTG